MNQFLTKYLILLGITVLPLVACAPVGGGSVAGPEQRQVVEVGNAPTLGPADAQVVLVEFADYQCPFCADEQPVVTRLLENYAGQLRFAFKQFPLSYHAHAYLAAQAALAAYAQDSFWPYHNLLFSHQRALTRNDLESYAATLGLDLAAFNAAIDTGAAQAAIEADVAQGDALGIGGTPAFFVNGRLGEGALSYQVLAAAIDDELNRINN